MWKKIIFASFLIHFIHCQQCIQSHAGPKVTPTSASPTNVSISVVWDDCTQSVYYVDFFTVGFQPSLYRYDYNTGRTYSAYVVRQAPPSFIIPISTCMKSNNQFLVGFGPTAAIVEWDGISPVATYVRPLFTIPTDDPTISLAVGRQEGDAQGRFYVGTFHITFCSGANNASFYEYSKEKGLQQVFTGTISTTGTTTDLNARKLYNLDTCSGLLTSFRLDNGKICKGRLLYDFSKTGKLLIGLDVDEDGQLYSVSYADGSIVKINPKTGFVQTIAQIPAAGAGGVTFGGPDRKTLFAVVGSSVINPSTAELVERKEGPSLYEIRCVGGTGRKYTRLIL